ncbi:MAG: hypothetical protein JOY96_01655 [Verrucomicrobia bacterium]|nr:hypothetical protein [Verrucomicrobiota bacterium]
MEKGKDLALHSAGLEKISIRPGSLALLVGSGLAVIFCRAFLGRLAQHLGEKSADQLLNRSRQIRRQRDSSVQPDRFFIVIWSWLPEHYKRLK